jgi:hypothetical protein
MWTNQATASVQYSSGEYKPLGVRGNLSSSSVSKTPGQRSAGVETETETESGEEILAWSPTSDQPYKFKRHRDDDKEPGSGVI